MMKQEQSRPVKAPEVIDLDRIRLRRPKLSDAAAMFECGSDPDVARYADWPIRTSIDSTIERMNNGDRATSSIG